MSQQFDILAIMTNFLAILISLTLHEFAHAYVADKMGDPTPRRYDRLNLNPITIIKAHPFGALIVPLIGATQGFLLGWAATPVNPHLVNRKYSLRQAERWIALAGPLSNVLLAILSALFLAALHIIVVGNQPELRTPLAPLLDLSEALLITNIFLALFNMIPIPPFDGFTVLSSSIPRDLADITKLLEQYGNMIILFVLFFGGRILSPIIYTCSRFLYETSVSFFLLFY